MILLTLLSLLPYVVLIASYGGDFHVPPMEQILVTISACAVYHASFLLSCRKLGYSFLTITCFFFWIFMGLAPMLCSFTGRWLWGNITFEMSEAIIFAALCCLVFLAFFAAAHRFAYKAGKLGHFLTKGGSVSDARLFIGLWFSLAASLLVLGGLGIEGTFFRSGYDSYVTSGITALFIQNFFRPMPLLIGVPMLWILLKSHLALAQPRTWLALATVVTALMVNFPLSVARFYGWTVIGVFFYYANLHPQISRRTWVAGVFLLLGFMGSFVADIARYAKTAAEVSQSFRSFESFSTESFYVGHVDAFEMLVYGTEYVAEKGTTQGRQALAVTLFWMPRDYWPEKPLPTGALMGTSFINLMTQTTNTNLSAPLILEGYINFGMPGVILFAILAGLVAGTLDRALNERHSQQFVGRNLVFGIDAIAAPLMGLWVYLLRGSLLPAVAYSTGFVVAGLLMWKFFFRPTQGSR